jgi:hypothetical protein
MPSREGTGNCVTTSATIRLAASGWLFIWRETRFEFAERAGALALFTVACGKVASLRHRLTRDMKAKCYKNMSAVVKISPVGGEK